MSLHPITIDGNCPGCGADVRFEPERMLYAYADHCGYTRRTLQPDPADLVKRNGHAPPVELTLTPEEMSGFVARPVAASPEPDTPAEPTAPTLPAEIGWYAPTPPGYLTYRELAERWCLSESGARSVLAKTGTPLHRVPVPGTRHQRVFVAAADADKINPNKIPGLHRRARPRPGKEAASVEAPALDAASVPAPAPVGEPSEPEPAIVSTAPAQVANVVAETIAVRLRSSGGLVTLRVETAWMKLDRHDRAFVCDLIDHVERHGSDADA